MVYCNTFYYKRWLALIRRTRKLGMPKFLLFGVFRRTLKNAVENPACYLPPQNLKSWKQLCSIRWWIAFKQNNTKPTKNSCKAADFRQFLRSTCGLNTQYVLSKFTDPSGRGMTMCFARYWLIGQSREPRDLTCWFRLPTHLLSSETRWFILNWLVPGVCSCEYALWVCGLDFELGSSFFGTRPYSHGSVFTIEIQFWSFRGGL